MQGVGFEPDRKWRCLPHNPLFFSLLKTTRILFSRCCMDIVSNSMCFSCRYNSGIPSYQNVHACSRQTHTKIKCSSFFCLMYILSANLNSRPSSRDSVILVSRLQTTHLILNGHAMLMKREKKGLWEVISVFLSHYDKVIEAHDTVEVYVCIWVPIRVARY
jgi:hypothetical protein